MMRRMLFVAATATAVLTGISCNPTAGSILPMTVGNVWNTELYALAGLTGTTLDTFETGVTTTTALDKASLTNGKEVVKLKSESTVHLRTPDSTSTTTTYSWLAEEDGAILSYGALDDTIGDTLMMSSPAVGQSWSPASGTAMVVGQEDVTVAAGTYKKAWKVMTMVNIGGVTVKMFTWYARGVGNVKMHYEGAYLGYSQVYDEELTSATIK